MPFRDVVHTLRFRLAALNLLVFGLILAVVMGVILVQRRHAMLEDFDASLSTAAEHVLRELTTRPFQESVTPHLPYDPLHSHAYYFALRSEDGSLVHKSSSMRFMELPFDEAARGAGSGRPVFETLRDERFDKFHSHGCAVRLLTIRAVGAGGAPFFLQTATSLDGLERMLAGERRLVLWLFPAGLLAIGIGSWLLASHTLRPVKMVAEDAAALTVDHLSQRLRAGASKGDVGEMITCLNQMLDRIERGFRAQERFLAEVSHELRTPVAVLTGQAQVLGRKVREPEEYDEFVASVESEMHRLSEMINSFLLLARANAGLRASLTQMISLNDLVTQTVQRCQVLASHREVSLIPRLWMPEGQEGEPQVRGDEELLLSMLGNLVMNAVRHSPVGESVTIELVVEGREAVLTVLDRGPGITSEMLAQLFEPFASTARCGTKGAGLGLAIARSVAEFHGGSIAGRNRPDGGCVFTVRLPLADAE